MSDQPRVKRPALERTRPIRNVLGAFRQGDGREPAASSAPLSAPLPPWAEKPKATAQDQPEGAEPRDGWAEGIEGAVRSAYALIDDQIREGQRIAGEINPGPFDLTRNGSELSGMLSRLVRCYTDLGVVWIELIGAAASDTELKKVFSSLVGSARSEAKAPPPPPAAGTCASAARDIMLEVLADRGVSTRLNLFANSAGSGRLIAQPLQALTPGVDPISDLGFRDTEPGGTAHLRIQVPAAQPDGTYHGLICDAETGAPIGAVTVMLGQGPAHG